MTYGLIFMGGLLTVGGWGWLVSDLRHDRIAAEEYEEELEVAELQRLYAATDDLAQEAESH